MMLRYSMHSVEEGLRFAMGNAPDELKDLADWVAPSVEEHGFAVAMERYGLIGQ
jgi:hydroxymethylpyrimidine pyrophosphatase-like HAD family hydrolase